MTQSHGSKAVKAKIAGSPIDFERFWIGNSGSVFFLAGPCPGNFGQIMMNSAKIYNSFQERHD